MSRKTTSGSVRLIAGKWRGRKIHFPAVDGLRPTTDRIRETVFNWLQPYIQDARCLDLFAGSGALGLEALSRGAQSVCFVDNNPRLVKHLQDTLTSLNAEGAEVVNTSAEAFIATCQTQYDLIFLDPPFHQDLVRALCEQLDRNNIVGNNSLIYIETEAKATDISLPTGWRVLRSKVSGHVAYQLIIKEGA